MSARIAFLFAIALLGIGIRRDADAALNTDPFVYDPAFYGGNAIEDRFAGSVDADYLATKLAKFDIGGDGDIVVAGRVPQYQMPNQSGGLFNIGLVRYGPAGERRHWAASGMTHYYDTYLIYPATPAEGKFTALRDVKILNGFIHVLVDYQTSTTNSDVRIVTFTGDGQYVDDRPAFNTPLDEHAAGLAPYWYWCGSSGLSVCHRMIAVATYTNSSGRRIITAKRFFLGSNGSLGVDTPFGPYGNGANDYLAPNSACLAATQCSAHASAVAISQMIGADAPVVYVGGEMPWNAQQKAAAVLAIDGRTGNVQPGFGNDGGFARYPFAANDIATGIAATDAYSDGSGRTVYLSAWIQTYCAPAIGLLKLDSNGNGVAGFGNTSVAGMAFIGGDNDPSHCSGTLFPKYIFPQGIALDANRLAIAGFEMRHEGGNTYTNPLLTIVRSSDGAVLDSRAAPPPHAAGAVFTNGGIWNDVIAYNDRFVTAGPLVDSLGIRSLFGTARFRSDRIFGNDFD